VVYGDSLSDNGNLFAATGQPPPPYFAGRVSNGPVAVEYLASALGVPLVDFAWAGATTGLGNFVDGGTATDFGAAGLPGMQTVFAATSGLLAPHLADGLFVVWGGPNDFFSPSVHDTTPADTISRAVTNLLGLVTSLQALGAENILVPGMPDLGLTPSYSGDPVGAALASAATDAFNAALLAGLPAGVRYFDTATLVRSMVADPAAFGFVNVTTPCFDAAAMTVCADPDTYLFWDSVHPTTAAHALLGAHFEGAVAVSEPGILTLIGLGLVTAYAHSRATRSRRR
jgi:phospholipase/lecithinase/hemolysin